MGLPLPGAETVMAGTPERMMIPRGTTASELKVRVERVPGRAVGITMMKFQPTTTLAFVTCQFERDAQWEIWTARLKAAPKLARMMALIPMGFSGSSTMEAF